MTPEQGICFDSNKILALEEIFPFETTISLTSAIEYWRKAAKSDNKFLRETAIRILEEWKKLPELHGPVDDELHDKHVDFIESVLEPFIPLADEDHLIISLNKPFSLKSVLSTFQFKKIFGEEISDPENQLIFDAEHMVSGKIISAIRLILDQCYNISSESPAPMTLGIRGNNDLIRYYQLSASEKFINVSYEGNLEPVDKDILHKLLHNKEEFKNWNSIFPPNKFKFSGIAILNAVDVTESHILSLLKYDLLEKKTIISMDRFYDLRGKLRSYFNLPSLRIGLAAFTSDWQQDLEFARKVGNSFILNDSCALDCNSFQNSIYDKAVSTRDIQIIEDLAAIENPTIVEKEILKLDIRNLLVVPLFHNDKFIGIFELGSPLPGILNQQHKQKIDALTTLFNTAVKRSLDDFESTIQGIIKEDCTAIHPTVEWRFRKAAINKINNGEDNSELEPIIFNNLYPLYALSDIRNSSNYRVEAIKEDLIEHMHLIENLLGKFQRKTKLPYIAELLYQIDVHKKNIEAGLSSGDEVEIIDFITKEIEPVFTHVTEKTPDLLREVQSYKQKLDPSLKVFYKRRKDFEKSVSSLNETITGYINTAEIQAQNIFPFFSEKYKTDGVEHSIYIGESLVEDRKFSDIYLKNLRLWQIMLMCGVVKKAAELKPKMKIQLDTAQLILVQHNPLSIRFRYDEKKFDVDGTYNIRYEIMKKRIDKAIINGSKERLTQPGKIAIVYSQNREAIEYKRYLEFLKSRKMIKGEIEYLELEELQGVKGLKAIRFEVDLVNVNPEDIINNRFITN
ncbi:MAG: hypothetical protein SCALA702_30370 [Melioribacteraceae bacterium]|nr:MAG: hypothetical protein SCALA702_30370 [Melioribacteraceae bacterium]